METKKIMEKIKKNTEKEISLSSLCDTLEMGRLELLSYIYKLKEEGINISTKQKDDDIYLYNHGEKNIVDNYKYNIKTDDNTFKFVAISDTRIGSIYQQPEILQDIYNKANDLGYKNVILCGNITEGLYPVTNKYSDTIFLSDTLMQVEYIANNYPYIEGMKTYFITGKKDEKHMQKNKINIGKRISELRDDMIYLGDGNCLFQIDKAKMFIFCQSLEKTYTVSYRSQQQIDSFRSEDKPDILLHGGLLQMQKFTYRGVNCISAPSVCATSKEMVDKRHSNTVGAWYVTIKTDKKGNLKSVRAMDSVYYKTDLNQMSNKQKKLVKE